MDFREIILDEGVRLLSVVVCHCSVIQCVAVLQCCNVLQGVDIRESLLHAATRAP